MGKELNRCFSKATKKGPAGTWKVFGVLIIQELQIKATRCHYTPVRKAVIHTPKDGNWSHKEEEIEMCLVTMENTIEAPQEGKTEQPYGTQLQFFFFFKKWE